MAAFRWVLLAGDGKEMRATDAFDSKEQAEEWLGTAWQDMLEEGAESVSLRAGGDELYEMGLREA